MNLRHHGDREAAPGLLDFAVNVYDGPRPDWLDQALVAALGEVGRYPDPSAAEAALTARHGRAPGSVLATAGAAEAFTLIARWREWRQPIVVHPQFTEPDVALTQAGYSPGHVPGGFGLDPGAIPADADLVMVGNPTNPTGVLHQAATIRALLRPGRVLVVDEAFLDDGVESLAPVAEPGLVVVRSLTKLWSIPGVRAGYLLAVPDVVGELRLGQAPWSVSTPAAAAMVASCSETAVREAARRGALLESQRAHLFAGLAALPGVDPVAGSAPFVLAQVPAGTRERLRSVGIAVRRGDTFPGLLPEPGREWVRIAARAPHLVDRLLAALR